MFKVFIFCITFAFIAAQENGRPCNDQTGTNNGLSADTNSVNRQQRQGFRGINGGNQFPSNNYPGAANPPIGFGTNFPSERFPTGQFGTNSPQQNSQFGSQFGNQRFGPNGFGFGSRNDQNGQFGRFQFPNYQFGSNDRDFGSSQQGRRFQ
uniref:Uncharacterized protein n=1 Tax=Panagrolaimus sp. PS1159 TaxID=55785 RepID=A0AC35GM11_9BILA